MLETLSDRESSLRSYFDDIAHSEPLSREKEVELAARIKDGDMEARDELVQANLRFVIDVAKNYQNRGLSFADLISAGNLGLMTAAERFDGTRGYKFISYAVWWIRQSILQTIAEHVRTVRLPLNKLSLLKDISKASRRLGQGREEEPDVDEIAKELDLPADVVTDAILSARPVSSLDGAFEDDEKPLPDERPSRHQPAGPGFRRDARFRQDPARKRPRQSRRQGAADHPALFRTRRQGGIDPRADRQPDRGYAGAGAADKGEGIEPAPASVPLPVPARRCRGGLRSQFGIPESFFSRSGALSSGAPLFLVSAGFLLRVVGGRFASEAAFCRSPRGPMAETKALNHG